MRIYIEGMKEIPKDCGKCPIHRLIYSLHPASAICPIMKGTTKDITDISERSPNCPLRVQRQPNRFEAVVQILKDADFSPDDDLAEEEEYIKMIADEICQLFKDGPYDEEDEMAIKTDYASEDNTTKKGKNLELIIEVKTKGFEEAEDKIRKLKYTFNGLPAMIHVRELKDCEVNVYPSQTYFGGSEDE